VISPADGEVIIAEPDVDEPRFLHGRAAKISIFMSPLNVHVNRAPVDGEIVGVHYNAGKYFAAYAEKASLDNEQNAIVMRGDDGRGIVFVQIAGFLARRIVCRVRAGDRCRRGERVGMIKLGSRVDVFIPGDVDLSVKLGDRVRAGETVLGVLR
jgi:phosphatidylserine decarboxylase